MAGRPSLAVVAIVCAVVSVVAGGCDNSKPVTVSRQTTGKGFDSAVPRRPVSLLDRVDDSQASTKLPGSDQVGSEGGDAAGDGATRPRDDLFLVGGYQPFGESQVATAGRDNASFDMRLIDTDQLEVNYREAFARGEQLMQRGQFEQALVCFDEAKVIDPKNYLAYLGEAFCFFNMKNYGQSLAAIDFAIRASPDTTLLYRHRSQIRAQLGNFSGAIDDLTYLAEKLPDDVSLIYSRGQYYFTLGNHPKAAADFSAVLTKSPGDPMVLLYRAWTYYRMQKAKEAEADATAVLAKQPNVMEARLLRTILRMQSNDIEGSRTDFNEAVKLGLDGKTAANLRKSLYPSGTDAPPQ